MLSVNYMSLFYIGFSVSLLMCLIQVMRKPALCVQQLLGLPCVFILCGQDLCCWHTSHVKYKSPYPGCTQSGHIHREYICPCLICIINEDLGLTLKMPRKPASENVVCLCCLLNILSNFSNQFLHTGKQCVPAV